MSKSLIFYLDRSDTVQVFDSSSLSHYDDASPIMLIAVDIINAGYEGVIVDEQLLSNGRYFQALNTNRATPEGRILEALCKLNPKNLPPSQEVLEDIRRAYQNGGGVA